MRIPAAALTLLVAAAAPAAAQEFAGMSGLAESIGALKFTPAPPAVAESVPGKAVALANPDVGAYPVRGIDVSTWQDEIDWARVAQDGVSFAYIKATEGAGLVDDRFKRNWTGAAKAGLLRGAYHFWDFCESGVTQAAHFVNTVPKDAEALPPAIDLEESRDCGRMPSKDAFQKSLAVFVARVQKAYGKKPVLYVNASIYAKYLAGAEHGLKLWISDPHDKAPDLPAGTPWAMWQYSFKGTLPGISTAVDLDAFNGTPQMLAGLARPDDGTMLASLLP